MTGDIQVAEADGHYLAGKGKGVSPTLHRAKHLPADVVDPAPTHEEWPDRQPDTPSMLSPTQVRSPAPSLKTPLAAKAKASPTPDASGGPKSGEMKLDPPPGPNDSASILKFDNVYHQNLVCI